MKSFRLFLATLLCLSALSLSAADQPPLVILLGDSIRMNYQKAVTEELRGKAEVWAPKENCAHTAFTLANLDKWLTGRKPQVVHINVGLHDMYLSAKTGKTRHTIETYDKNLRAIFAKLDKLTNAKIIFALTTAVIEDRQAKSKGYKRVVRRNTDVDRFNSRARKIAKESGIAVNDLNAFMKENGPEKILRASDGIHLSPEGCLSVGGKVADEITKRLDGR
jgi:lysophospholipase L1-like esterase